MSCKKDLQNLSTFLQFPGSPSLDLHSLCFTSTSRSRSRSTTTTSTDSFPNWPSKLANAGFKYLSTTNNISDAVICNQCKLIFFGWKESYSPMAVHIVLKLNCPFLKAAIESRSSFRSSDLDLNGESISTTYFNTNNDEDQIIQDQNRRFNIRRQLFPPHNVHETETDSELDLDHHLASVSTSPFIPKDGNIHMLFESHRILSFRKPLSSEAAMYAAAGFKYCDDSSCAMCVFCELKINFIQRDPIALDMIHEEKSPHCPFAHDHFDVNNISSDFEREIKEKYLKNSYQTYQITEGDASIYLLDNVKHIEFKDVMKRKDTYKTWPKMLQNDFSPEKMAECGLYYSGKKNS